MVNVARRRDVGRRYTEMDHCRRAIERATSEGALIVKTGSSTGSEGVGEEDVGEG